jgi:phage-related minor tail protein
MPPQVKATLTLPFAIAIIAAAVIVLTSHPAIFIWGLMGISSIAILGSLWYSLFVMFGGEVE